MPIKFLTSFRAASFVAALFAFLPGQTAAQPLLFCSVNSGVPPLARGEGNAEYASDVVLVCTGGDPLAPLLVNFQLFASVALTSNVTDPPAQETEALLLIDEPLPAALNNSNGYPYTGQVKGQPGVPAGDPGSGNVYQGVVASANAVAWLSVPFVPPGDSGQRIIRLTNIRVAASTVAASTAVPVEAYISVTSSTSIPVTNPQLVVAIVVPGMTVTSQINGNRASVSFREAFGTAFKKRIENTTSGPTSPAPQNVPGAIYNTESGFTPDFATLSAGDVGSANVGTRLVAVIANIPAGVTAMLAPNSVLSDTGSLVLRRVRPPYGAGYAGGMLAPASGYGGVGVNAGRATVLYEVLPVAPYQNVNGAVTLDQFTVITQSYPATPLAGATIVGKFAPIDVTQTASGPAPEPRFMK